MAKKKETTTPENTEEVKDTQDEVVSEDTNEEATVELDEKDTQILELQEELKSTKDAFIRSLAEYDNFRKRSAKEKQNTYESAKVDCLSKLIPVLDNFERATTASDSDFDGYKKGMEMIYANFSDIITSLGVESFGEVGDSFDPNFHNGVMHIESEDFEENIISQVFSKGYKIGDKVLREAMVQVAN